MKDAAVLETEGNGEREKENFLFLVSVTCTVSLDLLICCGSIQIFIHILLSK